MRKNLQSCDASRLCDLNQMLTCQSNVCRCTSGYYFFETNCS